MDQCGDPEPSVDAVGQGTGGVRGRAPRNPASSVEGPGQQADPHRASPSAISAEPLKGHVTKMMPGAATGRNVLFPKRDGIQDGRKTKPTAQNPPVGFFLLLASGGRGAPGHPPSEGQHPGSRTLVRDSAAPAGPSCCVQDLRPLSPASARRARSGASWGRCPAKLWTHVLLIAFGTVPLCKLVEIWPRLEVTLGD